MIIYRLSLFQQKAFANYSSKGIPKIWWCIQVFSVMLLFVLVYLVYSWKTQEFQRLTRKNLACSGKISNPASMKITNFGILYLFIYTKKEYY